MKQSKKYYTTGDIARYCEVNINTVKNWIKSGNLSGFRTPSGHYRVPRKQFISFVKSEGFTYDQEYFGNYRETPDVLIVDDDEQHNELLVYILEQIYNDIEIKCVANGFDGYMFMYSHPPKLVLLDLMMPHINGLDFLRVMQSNKNMKNIKLVVISAHLTEKILLNLDKWNVDTVLEKPVKEDEFIQVCDSLLELEN